MVWGDSLGNDGIRYEQLPAGRPRDWVSASGFGGRVAARASSGTLRGRCGGSAGVFGVREGLSRLGLGVLSPERAAGALVYGYATGVFSSRKLERATYDSVAFRFIAANDHPDHDTIAAFRRRFLGQIEGLFVEVLVLAREAGMLRLARWRWTAPRCTPMRAGTVRCRINMPARSKPGWRPRWRN